MRRNKIPKILRTYPEISYNDAIKELNVIIKNEKDIIKECYDLDKHLSSNNPNIYLIEKKAKSLFRGEKFKRLKKLLAKLSLLNLQSRRRVKPIFNEIQTIRSLSNKAQTGDILSLSTVASVDGRNLSIELLQSQANVNNVEIIPKSSKESSKELSKESRKESRKGSKEPSSRQYTQKNFLHNRGKGKKK